MMSSSANVTNILLEMELIANKKKILIDVRKATLEIPRVYAE
jgi:hypothetical protein